MNTDADGRRESGDENDALAGGDFTEELTDGQLEADDESGSTDGTDDAATAGEPETRES
jgi:hypothetical protein